MATAAKKKSLPAEGINVILYESDPNSRGEVFRATLNRFKGKMYARLGKWYNDQGEWKPGKGISVPFDAEGLDDIQKGSAAIQKALEAYDA